MCQLGMGLLFVKLQLWQKCGKKVGPSFVMAISVSGECDTRDTEAKKSYESDL